MPSESGSLVGSAPPPVEPLALFEILIRENADSLTALLRAAVADASAVDDLFQETMLIAWRKIGEYDRSRPFGAWLRGIARRLILAHYRKASREISLSYEQVLDRIDHRMSQIDRQPGDSFDEKIAALKECIERLSPIYRAPIVLYYQDDQTAEGAARQLVTTKDTFRKRLQRARLMLAECLQRRGVLAAE